MPLARLHQCPCLLRWTSTQSDAKPNDINEEMDRLGRNGTQGRRSPQVEMQSICEVMDQSFAMSQ
eukprot:6535893-Lingulodinium_polyedra.AAC.1